MSDDKNGEGTNETVKAMGDQLKPDVPTGLAVVPKGTSAHGLARRIGGEIVQNEMEFHCLSCGISKTLQFDADELLALNNNIRDYSGPCPGCGAMTLAPKDALWGKDFPSMSALAAKNKRDEARVQAEEFVDVAAEKVATMMGGGMPKPTIEDPEGSPDRTELPDAPDPTKLTPR